MMKYITGSDLYAEIVMTRTAFKGAILVLEGTTDCDVFEEFRHPYCVSIPASGCEVAVDAIALCDQSKYSGILAVIDADFSRLGCSSYTSPNIVTTDAHDIELIVLTSPAFQRFIRQYCHEPSLQSFLTAGAWASLIEAILAVASEPGMIRWLAMKTGERLRFRKLNFASHIDQTTLKMNMASFLPALLANSPKATKDLAWIVANASALAATKPDLLQLCSGHDVCIFLGIGLKSALGKCSPDIADPRNIERMLRLAFGRAELEATMMYQAIREWERNNTPFRVLN